MYRPVFDKKLILAPVADCPWAHKMVLNPAMIADPDDPKHLIMLFRATGAWEEARIPGKPAPYPIFAGFGESFDGGENWDFDLSRPALAPRLEYDKARFFSDCCRDGRIFNCANGCMEDPRLFYFENALYLSIACRSFPPGPYWEHDDPEQCMPEWTRDCPELPAAVRENATITLLFKVDFAKLAARKYDDAFQFVCPLHNPDYGDDRDVVLFPRRLTINGKPRIVCVHRPKNPQRYELGKSLTAPSIFFALGDEITDFYDGKAEEHVFLAPEYEWEQNRVGVSFAPLELGNGEWLFAYHGKQDDKVGYTQSFLLLRETQTGLPQILRHPEERLLYADEPWELAGEFTIPCVFSCSGIRTPDNKLLMGYGAADEKVGIAKTDLPGLIDWLKVGK